MFRELKDRLLELIFSRMFVLLAVMLVLFSLLIHRIFQLQIINGESYQNNFTLRIQREKTIPSTRGKIYDCNGKILAYDELAYSVTIADNYESSNTKNAQMNDTIFRLIRLIEKNGDKLVNDFDIILDKDGNFADWWTEDDYAAFEARAQKLIAYYDTIVPFDGGRNYPGSNVQGEAIADMGGMKCMLLLAGDEEEFDYDAFFRAYAALWKGIYSREYCENIIYRDEHPMNYLRVNVTLMQQPEFYETYDIEEGDGMYMAEEDRIAVW